MRRRRRSRRVAPRAAQPWGLTPGGAGPKPASSGRAAVGRSRRAALGSKIEIDTGMSTDGRRARRSRGGQTVAGRRSDATGAHGSTACITHLARADEDDPGAAVRRQVAELPALVVRRRQSGRTGRAGPRSTSCNSGGLLRRDGDRVGHARPRDLGRCGPGLMLYGVSPFSRASSADRTAAELDLQPVMTSGGPCRRDCAGSRRRGPSRLRRRLASRRARRRIATLAIGYADGVSRAARSVGDMCPPRGGALRPIWWGGSRWTSITVVDVGRSTHASCEVGDRGDLLRPHARGHPRARRGPRPKRRVRSAMNC